MVCSTNTNKHERRKASSGTGALPTLSPYSKGGASITRLRGKTRLCEVFHRLAHTTSHQHNKSNRTSKPKVRTADEIAARQKTLTTQPPPPLQAPVKHAETCRITEKGLEATSWRVDERPALDGGSPVNGQADGIDFCLVLCPKTRSLAMSCELFGAVLRTNCSEFERFVPKTGLQFALKGSTARGTTHPY